jgi:4-diphosphocytidyl-2-C-methyl-D-erythritol kinase
MTMLRDSARAKLNLNLIVHGRRADLYHEIESLVAFADFGDAVGFEPGSALSLDVDGPFAAAIEGENLMLRAAQAAAASAPGLPLGRLRLTKRLPVAAGLGGGSADAACTLRLLSRNAPEILPAADLAPLARALGSDVSACLESRSLMMRGRGEVLDPVDLPPCAVLLVNPGLGLSAGEIYRALGAAPLAAGFRPSTVTPDFAAGFRSLVAYLARTGNDLQPAATKRAPVIAELIVALDRIEGAHCARLSGSGPTCFALFETLAGAKRGAAALTAANPQWWSVAADLTGGDTEAASNQ